MVQVRCMDERFPTTLDNLSRPTASAISTVPTVSPDASLHSAPDAYAVLQRGAVHAAATEYCLLVAAWLLQQDAVRPAPLPVPDAQRPANLHAHHLIQRQCHCFNLHKKTMEARAPRRRSCGQTASVK